LACAAGALLSGCRQVPFDYPREASHARPPAMDSRLGEMSREWLEPGRDESGFYPVAAGSDSLGLRLRLIESADATIDLQYFLMKPDLAGILMADQLLQAANRGVRIRFLLDDIFTSATDEQLAILAAHPNIEVRLFNPLVRGFGRWSSFLWNIRQSNRRMHNKSFTVDNIVTIVGGRNIADEYFEIQQEIEFADFDMVAVGPVAADISATFDLFWNSGLAVPLEAFVDTADYKAELQTDDEELLAMAEEIYARAVNSRLLARLQSGDAEPVPATATVVTDPPEKLINPKKSGYNDLINALVEAMREAREEIIIVTPYFVPGKEGVRFLQELCGKGVEITVITNSLASTNHAYVHGGYAPRRKPLLASGVELYEAMASPAITSVDGKPVQLTLHTKLVVIDQRLLFVGSLNIDPRSIVLNSEMGVLVDIPEVAAEIAGRIKEDIPDYSYRVILDDDKRLLWIDESGQQTVVHSSEPDASLWRRFIAGLVRLLPVEGQL
jgi:putative cardiolipin synthase